jgi:hypothetical protein
MNKEDFKKSMEVIMDSFDLDDRKRLKALVDAIEINKFSTPDEFYLAIIFPFERAISFYLDQQLNNRELTFIYSNASFVENCFQKVIQEKEGYACCADKSSYLMNCLVHHYKHGGAIQHNMEQEVTYHIPKVTFQTHEEIISFYMGVKALSVGAFKKYIEALKTQLEK